MGRHLLGMCGQPAFTGRLFAVLRDMPVCMQPMTIPSVGGTTVQLITLFIVPCLFCAVEEWRWRHLYNPNDS